MFVKSWIRKPYTLQIIMLDNNLSLPADQSWAKMVQNQGRNRVTECAESLYPIVRAVKNTDLRAKELANARNLDDFDLLRVTKEELPEE
jgi:hypothetical protein